MKFEASYTGPDGEQDWQFQMQYMNLPPEYVLELASRARAYLNLIKHTAGGASSGDRAYVYTFEYKADDKAPKVGAAYDELLKGEVTAVNLLYSQVVELQAAGITLQTRLLEAGQMEIKSGQRT